MDGIHIFRLEFLGHDRASKLRVKGHRKMASRLHPWVAEVRFKPDGSLDRTFVNASTDFTEFVGTGAEGIYSCYGLRERVVYQVRDLDREPQYYFMWHDGTGFVELTPAQAMALSMGSVPGGKGEVFKTVDANWKKKPLGTNVLEAAKQRIAWTFDTFPNVCVSFSAGKDSSVMLHLVMEEAKRRNRKVGLLLIDLEAQYQHTIQHGEECFELYRDHIEPYWVALPLVLRNAVSQYEPRWICWDPEKRGAWVREPPPVAITDGERFPFYRHAMEFEEFVEEFAHWFGGGELTACLVGIRAQESLNRFRALMMQKMTFGGRRWTTWKRDSVFNVYPIYDWKTEDIWRYNAKTGASYNRVYDAMHKAGLSIHQARICQPYGDDQRKGLWLFSAIEPYTWAKVVARVGGANTGALYAHKSGNMMGRIKVNLPPGHTWQSFASLLLSSMPPASKTHYENKIAVFLEWYRSRGVWPIPDDKDPELAERFPRKGGPSWKRICQVLLKQDFWCKGLSFTQTTSHAYERYMKLMRKRRDKWGFRIAPEAKER